MDKNEMKAYVHGNLKTMNDYSFMDTDYQKTVDTLVDLEMSYIDSITPDANGESEYDDEAAFEFILTGMKKDFPQYMMYLECLVDDYLEVSEAYLSEKGEIEWE